MSDQWLIYASIVFLVAFIGMLYWDFCCYNRHRPSFTTKYGTRVFENGLPWASVADVELVQTLVLEHYTTVNVTWTKERIAKVFNGYEIHFTKCPILILHKEPVRGYSTPLKSFVCWAPVISMTTLPHEIIHVLRMRLDGATIQQELDHKGWERGPYLEVIHKVDAELQKRIFPPLPMRH